jgi:hypothetical protein
VTSKRKVVEPVEPVEPIETDETDDDPVARAAERVRAAYVAHVQDHRLKRSGIEIRYRPKACWDGGYDPSSRRNYRPVWPRIAERIMDVGLDPVDAVKVLFDFWPNESSPTPNDIATEENILRTKNRKKTEAINVATAIKTQTEVFRSALWSSSVTNKDPDPTAPVRYVLNCLGFDLSPLFRYCIALSGGYSEQAARWHRAAAAQFEENPEAYVQYWKTLLPAHMLVRRAPTAESPT